MYSRYAKTPKQSFFLFGPRGTGKTTWLKAALPKALWVNLLNIKELQSLIREPDSLRQRIEALSAKSWVVIDEIQKLPSLLDEVHSLMNDFPNKYFYALTGSSARKLKQKGVNLLAGRAINRKFFPLTRSELGKHFTVESALAHGTLPAVCTAGSNAEKTEFLEAYAENYLKEEIQQDALIKNLEPFIRFLEIAAILNGQVINFSNIGREAGAGRTTVQGYFSILVETLLGDFVPAWKPRAKIKEVEHPKFYFFDPGVARALKRRVHLPVDDSEKGTLLETLVLAELRAWNHYLGKRGEIFYWGTPSKGEIDFIFRSSEQTLGIEVKATSHWKSSYGKSLNELKSLKVLDKIIGIYLGKDELKIGALRIYPFEKFASLIAAGKLL